MRLITTSLAAILTTGLLIGLPMTARAQDDPATETETETDAEGNELAELELAREKALDEADAANQKERDALERDIAEKGETKKLKDRRRDLERGHAGDRMRIEREFADKRKKLFGKKRGAVARDLSAIEDERTREVEDAEAEYERKLERARKSPETAGNEEAFENERAKLRMERNKSIDEIERKFGRKRRKHLEEKGKLHPHDAEDHPGKGDEGERGKSGEHRQDGEKRGHGRDKDRNDEDDEGGDDQGGDDRGGDGDEPERGRGKGRKK